MMNCGSLVVPNANGGAGFIFDVVVMTHDELRDFSGLKKKTLMPSKGARVIAYVGHYRNLLSVDDVCNYFDSNMTIVFQVNDMIPDTWDCGKDEQWVILD